MTPAIRGFAATGRRSGGAVGLYGPATRSSLGDDDLGRLDDDRHLVALGDAEVLQGCVCDGGGDIALPDLDVDFGHDGTRGHAGDGSHKLIASAQLHDNLPSLRTVTSGLWG